MPAFWPAFFMVPGEEPSFEADVPQESVLHLVPNPERRPSRTRWRAWLAIAATVVSLPGAAQDAPTEFRVIALSAGIHVIRAEVAMAPAEREKGLMYRRALGANQGMVFLFDQPAVQCMWMRNTLIPLSVAFIGDDGHILNVEEMAAQTDDNHCAAKPARYALEMNKGWFSRHGIGAGAQISGLPRVAR